MRAVRPMRAGSAPEDAMNSTENAICEALLDLMEEQPLRTIKVTKLAERAGISRSTFYLYFDSIDSVVERIESRFFKDAPKEIAAPYAFINEREWKHYFSVMSKLLREYAILTGPNGDPAFSAQLEERDRMSIDSSSSQQFRDYHSTELEVINAFIHGGKMYATRWWAEHEDEISVNDFSEIMAKLLKACSRIAQQ